MTGWRYPTAFSCWGVEERAAIARVMASGRHTMGPEVEAFEHEFAAWHFRKHGIMVNSGSSANLVLAHALVHEHGLSGRSTIGVPALAWSTTYAPFVQLGMRLALFDCDDTWNAVPDGRVRQCNVLVLCSILGNPVRLQKWVEREPQVIIEDNCESLGAGADGNICGRLGAASTFSFFHSHQISAIEGGMILTNNDKLAKLCRMLRAHGWSRDIEEADSFEREYDFRVHGFNVRPTEMHAAIAREQLKKLPQFVSARIKNLAAFTEAVQGLPIEQPRVDGTPSPFGIAFTVDAGRDARRRLAGALRERGIDCRLPTGGSFTRHAYGARWAAQMTPEADRIHDTGMFIGNAPWDISGLVEEAVEVMRVTLCG